MLTDLSIARYPRGPTDLSGAQHPCRAGHCRRFGYPGISEDRGIGAYERRVGHHRRMSHPPTAIGVSVGLRRSVSIIEVVQFAFRLW
jgi:hypothetical protein